MDKDWIKAALDGMLETLAATEHERWSHWQRYMHSKGTPQKDGSMLIPAELVQRWEQQMTTPYSELSDAEKDSDRDQVRKYLAIVTKRLTSLE